jgi:tRNA pseudouridine13 synthase
MRLAAETLVDDRPRAKGRIKQSPEDFVVEELPAYEPEGVGDHLFVRFTKRALTTDEAVRALARAASVQARDVGVAGLKDKVGVTTQTVSLPVPVDASAKQGFAERVRALALPGITIHTATLHPHKLRTAHLRGNRFAVTIRCIPEDRVDDVIAKLEAVGRDGLPNAFGSQRFGRAGDNAARALAWLTGKGRGPNDPRQKRFLWSALQSDLFNSVLARRVDEGTWNTPLAGDLLQKVDSGGLFACADPAVDSARAARGEVSPTGPMFGTKMRAPTGRPGELEREVFDERLGAGFDLARTKPYGEGARRGLCLRVADLTVERLVNRPDDVEKREQGGSLLVCFVLPRGAYATSVLGAAVDLEESGERPTDTADEERSTERAELE